MYNIVMLLMFLFVSVSASASSMQVSSSGEYMMIPSKPLVNGGVSFNEVDLTPYLNSKIRILNYSKLYHANSPSNVIVIKSKNDVHFRGKVEIVGSPASLVFIGEKEGFNVSCTACTFEGAERVIFAGSVDFSDENKSTIIKYSNAGTINLNGMNAYRTPYVLLVSMNTNLSGKIDLRSKASKDSNGSYNVSHDGEYYLGGSSLIIYNGNFSLDGEKFEPVNMQQESGPFNFGTSDDLQLNVSSLKVLNGGYNDLVLRGKYDTRSDILSAYTIDGKLSAIKEGVFLTTVSKGINSIYSSSPAPDIIFNATVISNGELYVSTQGNSVINNGASLLANNARVYAKKTVYNDGVMFSDNIDLVGNIVVNRRVIKAELAKLSAKKLLENNHGGSIVASQIELSSDGMLFNGSRSDKVYCKYNVSMFGNSIQYDCPNKLDGLYVNENIEPRSYLNAYDDVKFGSFYRSSKNEYHNSVEVNTYSNNSAYIYGDNVFIKARYIENINPYAESTNAETGWLNNIPVNFSKATQVGISADNKLEIVASEYFINSSSLVIYNNSNSQNALSITAKRILNERYRMSALYRFDEYQGYNIIKPYYYHYSLPGQIRSVGNVFLEASEGILNINSYLESYSKVVVNSPLFSSYGLNVSEDAVVNNDSVFNKIKRLQPECNSGYIDDFCLPRLEKPVEVVNIDVSSPFETDTLVYAGDGIKSNTNFIMDNWNLIDAFEKKVAYYIFDKYVRTCYTKNALLSSQTICDSFEHGDFNSTYNDMSIEYNHKYQSCSYDIYLGNSCSDNSVVKTVSAANVIRDKLDIGFLNFLNSFKEEIGQFAVN